MATHYSCLTEAAGFSELKLKTRGGSSSLNLAAWSRTCMKTGPEEINLFSQAIKKSVMTHVFPGHVP